MLRNSIDDHEKSLFDSAEMTRGQIQRLKTKITNLQSSFSEANVKYSQLLRSPQGDNGYVTLLKNSKKELDSLRASLYRRKQEKEDAEQVLRKIGNEIAEIQNAKFALRSSHKREKSTTDDLFTVFANNLLQLIGTANQNLYSDAQTVINFIKNTNVTNETRVSLLTGYIHATLLIMNNDDAGTQSLRTAVKDCKIDESVALNQYVALWMDHISELPSITRQSDRAAVEVHAQNLLSTLAADKVLEPETKAIISVATKSLMEHPEDMQARNTLNEIVTAKQKRKIYVPALIVGGIISLLAAATIAVSAALGALTLGMGAPMVIAGFVIGGSMMASGITMMLPPVQHCGLFTRRHSGRHDADNTDQNSLTASR